MDSALPPPRQTRIDARGSSAEHHGRILRTCTTQRFNVTETRYRGLTRVARHHHDRPAFSVVVSGKSCESFDGLQITRLPGGVLFRPAGIAHMDEIGRDGAHCLILEPATDWIASVRHELAMPDAPCFIDGHFSPIVRRLQGELQTNDACSGIAIEGIAMELAASATRALPSYGPKLPDWLRRARDLIAAHYREPLEMASVALSVGIHPVHLARAFRQHYHCTPGQFLRQTRLEAAARALASTDAPLVEVALAVGFSDQPHFTKAFKRFSHCTPAQFRRTAQSRSR